MNLLDVLSDCCEYSRKKVSLATANFGNKTKYEFVPNGLVSKIRFDDCNLGDCKKCDFLFVYEQNNEQLIFLELKDSDLINAIGQIESTIDRIKQIENLKGVKIHARVVLTKVRAPDIRDTRLEAFKRRIEKDNGSFDYKSQKLIERILK